MEGRDRATVGVYPGTFDPPTLAHLAVAEAAVRQGGLDRLELVISEDPLGKSPCGPTAQARVEALGLLCASRPWMSARPSPLRLIADLARGYDAVVIGADKWAQMSDPAWYPGGQAERDQALASLPRVIWAPRHGRLPPSDLPPEALVLELDEQLQQVSSSGARAGRHDWIAPEVRQLGESRRWWGLG